jgi:NADH dehydrogenase FAD-containing subunit
LKKGDYKMANFETVEVTTDLLIIGGGMSACGVALEAAHWAKKHNVKVTMVDKASVDALVPLQWVFQLSTNMLT